MEAGITLFQNQYLDEVFSGNKVCRLTFDDVFYVDMKMRSIQYNASVDLDKRREVEVSLISVGPPQPAYIQKLISENEALRSENQKLKALAHEGLPSSCVDDWGNDVKFCKQRQGDGNKCKKCSRYGCE